MGILDRYGEPIEPDDETPPQHDPSCVDGWLGEDTDGKLRPCPTCRPWLCPCSYCGRTRATCSRIPGGCCGSCPHHEPRAGRPR